MEDSHMADLSDTPTDENQASNLKVNFTNLINNQGNFQIHYASN